MLKKSLIGCDVLFDVEARQSIAYSIPLSRFSISWNWVWYHREDEKCISMNPQFINITMLCAQVFLQPAILILNIPK